MRTLLDKMNVNVCHIFHIYFLLRQCKRIKIGQELTELQSTMDFHVVVDQIQSAAYMQFAVVFTK